MSERTIIVANRLPYSIALAQPEGAEEAPSSEVFTFRRSDGGLVSGLAALTEKPGTLWLGWADTQDTVLNGAQRAELAKELAKRGCAPVFLDNDDAKSYYDGFSNSVIWPLFHYFPQFATFQQEDWESYVRVNQEFCDALVAQMGPQDIVWVHDYHLMLLPAMVREKMPDATIGFFLHIPYPSYETFRMLPWRAEILAGVLGADLIGFHTYDYNRHFLSSCRRIMGLDNQYGTIHYDGRIIQTDAFPLGIDYELYRSTGQKQTVRQLADEFIGQKAEGVKVILSVERLDYTKGIVDCLHAYDVFLETHPEWEGKVVFAMVVVPSRESVGSYHELKRQVDELVGSIEGKYSTVQWAPIDYYYRSLPFEQLCSLYAVSDVMIVTPLRDGMNLVSKEYLAVHDDDKGVLILSEMAGSAYELNDAVIINPFNQQEYVEAIERALTMPEEVQRRRNTLMQKRLKQYTSEKWATDVMDTLRGIRSQQNSLQARRLNQNCTAELVAEYNKAKKRALLLDYDGTLVPFQYNPADAGPDAELLALLQQLCSDERNNVVLISGRDKQTLDSWFGKLPIDLIAEHGMWQYNHEKQNWMLPEPVDDEWKPGLREVLEGFVIRTPGSFIEEKDYSLVWHCRACNAELAQRRMNEIRTNLSEECESKGLMILQGNKVVEIKPKSVNKGKAAYAWLQDKQSDFAFAAGDDVTDEDIFNVLPDTAWTIKVGMDSTTARFYLKDYKQMRKLLGQFV